MKFKKGEYATCETQIVKIIEVRMLSDEYVANKSRFKYRVQLTSGGPSSWVHEHELQELDKQQTAKVLYD